MNIKPVKLRPRPPERTPRPTPARSPVRTESRPAPSRPAAVPPVRKERSTLDIIAGIRDGTIATDHLSPEDRRACVAHLGAEGVSVPEIARVLKCSDRTITRDRRALQEEARITHDPALAGLIAGRMLSEGQAAVERILRVLREKDCPHAVRVDGNFKGFQILDLMVQRLQSLGFLPMGTQRLEMAVDGNLSIEELQAQFIQLQRVSADIPERKAPPADPALPGGPS